MEASLCSVRASLVAGMVSDDLAILLPERATLAPLDATNTPQTDDSVASGRQGGDRRLGLGSPPHGDGLPFRRPTRALRACVSTDPTRPSAPAPERVP